MSFGEMAVLVIVGLVVMGPKELPKMLRKLGQWAGKARRMAADMRAQSGIDDVLREGGLNEDLNEIRKLARGEIDGVVRAARIEPARPAATAAAALAPVIEPSVEPVHIARDREYPLDGADSYGALPERARVYSQTSVKSPLAEDALYTTGVASSPSAAESSATTDLASSSSPPAASL